MTNHVVIILIGQPLGRLPVHMTHIPSCVRELVLFVTRLVHVVHCTVFICASLLGSCCRCPFCRLAAIICSLTQMMHIPSCVRELVLFVTRLLHVTHGTVFILASLYGSFCLVLHRSSLGLAVLLLGGLGLGVTGSGMSTKGA